MNNETRNRIRFISNIEKELNRRIKRLQTRLFNEIMDYLTTELLIENGVIRNVAKNLAVSRKISLIQDSFYQDSSKSLLSWIAKNLIKLHSINSRYFNTIPGLQKSRVDRQAEITFKKMADRYGIKGNNLIRNGFLYDLGRMDNVFKEIKSKALKSVSTGQESIRSFRTRIDEFIRGDENDGEVQRYFKRISGDIFAEFEREDNLQIANALGLRAAIYQGGIIKSTRDFCKVRNGKVFTIDEIKDFGTSQDQYGGYVNKSQGAFQGKNRGYTALSDQGGYNCRHTYDWISDEMAIRRRPELREVWKIAA